MLELISPLLSRNPTSKPIKAAPSGSSRHGYGHKKRLPVPLWLSALSGLLHSGAGSRTKAIESEKALHFFEPSVHSCRAGHATHL